MYFLPKIAMDNGREQGPLKKRSGLEIGGNLNTTSLKIPLTTKVVSGGVTKSLLFKKLYILYLDLEIVKKAIYNRTSTFRLN